MKFSETEIEMARKLRELELPWHPQPGQYVYDIKGIIEKPSPFQDGVYFILDIKHFLRRAGTVEDIKNAMCWLPQWEDCRDILTGLNVPWAGIEKRLVECLAFEKGGERAVLYEIILEQLQ